MPGPDTVAPARAERRVLPGPIGFVEGLRSRGARVALVADDGDVSYEELARRVDEVAAGLGPVRRLVALAVDNRLDSVVAYLGALRGGHPVVLLPADRTDRFDHLVERYRPDVVAGPTVDGGWALEERHAGSAHELHPALALLLSTSGSTGSAKLVRLSATNLDANAASVAASLGLRPTDRAITSLPLHYCYGLSVLHSHLHVGASVVLSERSVVDPCFWDVVGATGVTNLAGVPHTFELLDRVGLDRLAAAPALRFVTQAGGRLEPDHVARVARTGRRDGWRLFVMYGQTEATARMACLPAELSESHPGAIGVPVPGGSFTVEPVDGLDDGGELVYRGPNVMLGYAEDPTDLALGRTVDELRTGDLGRLRPDGLYEVVGRRSRFVKPFGLRVDLDEVERWLAAGGVVASCTGDDRRLAIAVAPSADGPPDPIATGALVAGRVGIPLTAVGVVAVAALPRLANGKPDLPAVARLVDELAPEAVVAPDAIAGFDAVRRALAGALQLPESAIGPEDTFVGLGGDSLSYVEASLRLEAVLGELPDGWHRRALGALGSVVPVARPRSRLETGVVVRAVAITMVVATHTGIPRLAGGAHVLLAVAGANFARFQLPSGRFLVATARVAVPSALWLTYVAATDPRVGPAHVLMVNGWLGADDGLWRYWFVEALVTLVVVLGALCVVGPVRRLQRARPELVALAVLATGLAVRFDLVGLPEMGNRIYRPHEVLWIFGAGWLAAVATGPAARLVASCAVMAAAPGFFGQGWREALLVGGVLLLVWVPSLPVPRPLRRPVGAVAGASLAIYLTHWVVYERVLGGRWPLAGLTVSLLVGVATWALWRAASGSVVRGVRHLSTAARGDPAPLARQ